MSLINVGVVGSCVSRDVFNSKFNAGYSNNFNCKFSLTHVSIPSFVSSQINFNVQDIDHVALRDKNAIINELSREYLEVFKKSNDLDYLILDFWTDVFFGSVLTSEGIFTNNKWRILKTSFFKDLEDKTVVMPLIDQEVYLKVWQKSVDEFLLTVKRVMPNTKIIINKARAVDKYVAEDGQIKKLYSEYDLKRANNIWEKMDSYCIDKYHFDYIDVFDHEYTSHEQHPWGKYMVHYTKDFYEKFLMELTCIVINDVQNKLYSQTIGGNMLPNMIDNSDFREVGKFWSNWNDNFSISKKIISINNSNLNQHSYDSVLSNPIKVVKGQKYKLSFKFLIHDDVEFDSYKSLAVLRLFKNSRDVLQRDSIWFANLKYTDFLEKEIHNEWVPIKFEFTAKFNGFLKIGPSISQNGHVSWKDFYLFKDIVGKGDVDNDWAPSYNDILSN